MQNLDWMDELDLQKVLSGDAKLVYENCGLETFKLVWSRLPGIPIYPSKTALIDAMKAFIRKNFNGSNHKDIAIKLGVTERYVREVIGTTPRGLNDTIDIFSDGSAE